MIKNTTWDEDTKQLIHHHIPVKIAQSMCTQLNHFLAARRTTQIKRHMSALY